MIKIKKIRKIIVKCHHSVFKTGKNWCIVFLWVNIEKTKGEGPEKEVGLL